MQSNESPPNTIEGRERGVLSVSVEVGHQPEILVSQQGWIVLELEKPLLHWVKTKLQRAFVAVHVYWSSNESNGKSTGSPLTFTVTFFDPMALLLLVFHC